MTADRAMETLLGGLDGADLVIRADAARLLGELGPNVPRRDAVVEALLRYVEDEQHYAKAAGFNALAKIGDRSACDRLGPLVDKPNVFDDWYWYGCKATRASVALALLELGDDAGAAYLDGLAEKNDDTLYCWFGPTVLRLSDELEASRRLKGRITVDALLGAGARGVRRTEPGIMTMIAEVLGLLGDETSQKELIGMTSFHSRYVRGQAALSLLVAAPTAEHVALVGRMADEDATEFVRVKASLALVLAGKGGAPCGERIARIAREAADGFDRAVAVESLGIAGDRKHSAAVEAALGDQDEYARLCAVDAMERLGGPAARKTAAAALNDGSARVRLQGAKSIVAAGEGK